MDAQLSIFDAAINRFLSGNAKVFEMLGTTQVVPRIAQRIGASCWWANGIPSSPLHQLLLTVFIGNHLFTLAGEGTVHAFI